MGRKRGTYQEECYKCGAMVKPTRKPIYGLLSIYGFLSLPLHTNPETGATCFEMRSKQMIREMQK